MTVILDRVEDIDLIWPALEPWFASVEHRTGTDLTPPDIREAAKQGRLTLWAIYDTERPVPLLAAAASGALDSDGVPVTEILSLGGRDFSAWGPTILAEFERLARDNGMKRVRIVGRPGWARRLRRLGYHVAHEYLGEPKRFRVEKCL